MKQITLTFLISIILLSCNNGSSKLETSVPVADTLTAEEKNFMLAKQNAKEVFNLMNEYINESEKVHSKTKTKALAKVYDKKMRPYQERLDSLKALLSPAMVAQINEYRQQLLNDIQNGTYK
jgi:hypothetical protein